MSILLHFLDSTRASSLVLSIVTLFFLPPSSLTPHPTNPQTQEAMERWNISNVRLAVEKGKLRSPVPEQADMAW